MLLAVWTAALCGPSAAAAEEPPCLTAAHCEWSGNRSRDVGDDAEAVRLYREGCSRVPSAAWSMRSAIGRNCTRLAWMVAKGRGSARDGLAAARLYGRAWRRNDSDAERSLGELLERRPALVPVMRQGCDGGNAEDCHVLGILHMQGLAGEAQDPQEAFRLWQRACRHGHCGGLSEYSGSDELVASLARQACDDGIAQGCRILGGAAVGGDLPRGVADDPGEVAHRLRQTCLRDENPADCREAGRLLSTGEGVERDLGEASHLFRRACYAGDVESCTSFGAGAAGGDVARGLHRACDAGNADACGYLAFVYRRGRGVARDDAEAARHLRRACDGGDAYSCRFLGFLAESGQGVARDDAEAARLYRLGCGFNRSNAFGCSGPYGEDSADAWRHHVAAVLRLAPGAHLPLEEAARRMRQACETGDPTSCRLLAGRYGERTRSLGPAEEATRLLRRACDGGNVIACWSLGYRIERGQGAAKDPAEAARLFQRACEAGFASTCWSLGRDYESGRDLAEDLARAARLFRRGCAAGHPHSCHRLANLTAEGRGVAPDTAAAARLYQQACDGGSVAGCEDLGRMIMRGEDATRDATFAARLFRETCRKGSAQGCRLLGYLHVRGTGVQRDDTEAVRFYRLGCEDGHIGACASLGYMTYYGRGVERDAAAAARLWRRACDGGNAPSCTNLGASLVTGKGVEADYAEAAKLFARGFQRRLPVWLENPDVLLSDIRSVLGLDGH